MRVVQGAIRRRRMSLVIAPCVAAALLPVGQPAVAGPSPLLPLPAHATAGTGSVRIDDGARIVVPAGDTGAASAARRAVEIVARTRGITLRVADRGPGAISFVRLPATNGGSSERYRLDVTPAGIRIAAATDAGLF